MTQVQAHGAPDHQGWSLRPATADDASWMAGLKTEAMRADLQRLGDRDWARWRFVDSYVPTNTSVVLGRVLWITNWGSALSETGSLNAIQHGLCRRGSSVSPRFQASEDRQDRP